jgi:hypothetical protein
MKKNKNSNLSKTDVGSEGGGKGKMQNALSKIKNMGLQKRSPMDQ